MVNFFTHDMDQNTAIALAIRSDLDIIEACPGIQAMPIEEIEPFVEAYVLSLNSTIEGAIRGKENLDPLYLAGECVRAGADAPPYMLQEMMRTVVALRSMNARKVAETDTSSVWYAHFPLSL